MIGLLKLFYSALVTSFLCSLIDACSIADRFDSCMYTVVCESFAGAVNNPVCNNSPNVTFIVRNSASDVLTSGFFSTTNFDSKVRNIIFKYNYWHVIDKLAFKFYKGSVNIDLSENRFEIIENNAFLDLISVKYLNLSHNMIMNLYNKSFQVSITSQSALNVLDLSFNNIENLPSNVFNNFLNLQELYINSNKIKIMSETCFNNLNHLKRLEIQNNYLSSINMTLASLTELKYLDISFNLIIQLHGFELVRLISLEKLNVSFNEILRIDHTSFTQVTKLEVLDLSNNKINSTLENDMFITNHKLQYLNLFNNKIQTISPKIFQFNVLSYLNLENNCITGDITNNLQGLHHIISLNITNQEIKSIRDYAFTQMENLQFLNLSHNHINVVENSSFVNASSLSILDMSHNQITNLYFFTMFETNLTYIDMSNNNILLVPEGVFEGHKNIIRLDISKNSLLSISQHALPLKSLEYLELTHNNVSGTINDNVLSPAKFLRYLDLSNVQLETLNASAIIDLPLAARVNLSHNHLEFIHPHNFRGLNNMYSLDISNNKLSNLALETQLPNLKAIYLSHNEFTSIPNIFGNESKLEYFDLAHNNLSSIEDSKLKNILHIKVLHLSYNKIVNFNNEYTNSLKNLIELDLASNFIGEMINISFYKNLQAVNLSNNEISHISNEHFRNVDSLKVLSLSGNKVMSLNPGTFQDLKSLILLDISSNYITKLRFGTFRGLVATQVIISSRNKLKKLDVTIFHECISLNTLVIDYNFISSIDINKLKNAVPSLKVLSLGGNPIECEEIVQARSNISEISVTSLHKIYHDDNVHGIKCGGNNTYETVESITTTSPNIEKPSEIPFISILLVWCGVLSALILFGFIALYIYRKHSHQLNVQREAPMQFQNTRNSACYSDLLN